MEQTNTVTATSLFHAEALKQALRQGSASSEKKALLQNWTKNLDGLNAKAKADRHSAFLQNILIELLGYSAPDTLLDLSSADSFFDAKLGSFKAADSQVELLYKLMDAGHIHTDEPDDRRSADLIDEARTLAEEAGGAQFLLLTNLDEVRIYSLTNRRKTYEGFTLSGMADDSAMLERFLTLLAADSLLAGNTKALLTQSLESYLRDKMTLSKHRTLKEAYGELKPGVPYGIGDPFILDYPTFHQMMQEEPSVNNIVSVFFPADSYRQWYADTRPYWMIYTPKGKVNIEHYPLIRQHLEAFREDLEKRGGDQKWYELPEADNTDLPRGTELRVATGSLLPAPGFVITKKTSQFGEGSYYIDNADYFLFALLNSPAMRKLITIIAPQREDGLYELHKDLLESLPIPSVTGDQATKLGRWSHFTMEAEQDRNYLVKHVLAMVANELSPDDPRKPTTDRLQNWYELDFDGFQEEIRLSYKADIPPDMMEEWSEHFYHEQGTYYQLFYRIEEVTQQIDEIVFRLFDLDEDDIATVKGS